MKIPLYLSACVVLSGVLWCCTLPSGSPLQQAAAFGEPVYRIISFLDGNPLLLEQANRGKAAPGRKAAGRRPVTKYRGQYPEASERILVEKDVRYLTPWGRNVMINEIYARHGQVFTDRALRNHFRKEKWYRGKYRNVDKMLTQTERTNIDFIRQHQ